MQQTMDSIYAQYKLPDRVAADFWLGVLVAFTGLINTILMTWDYYRDTTPIIVFVVIGILGLVFVSIIRAVFLGAGNQNEIQPRWLRAVFVGDVMIVLSTLPAFLINSSHNVAMEIVFTVLFAIAIFCYAFDMFEVSGAPTGRVFSFFSALATLLIITAMWTDNGFIFTNPNFLAGFSFLLLWRGCYIIKESRWIEPENSIIYLEEDRRRS